jgi:hypothetical protein
MRSIFRLLECSINITVILIDENDRDAVLPVQREVVAQGSKTIATRLSLVQGPVASGLELELLGVYRFLKSNLIEFDRFLSAAGLFGGLLSIICSGCMFYVLWALQFTPDILFHFITSLWSALPVMTIIRIFTCWFCALGIRVQVLLLDA